MPENTPGIYEDQCKTRANYVSIVKVHMDSTGYRLPHSKNGMKLTNKCSEMSSRVDG